MRGRVGFAAGCPFDLFHCAGVQLGCRTQANFGVVDGFGFLQVVHLFVGQVVHEGAVGRESVQEQQVFVAGLFRWGLGFGGGRVFRGEFAREHFRGIVFWHTLIIGTTSAHAENTSEAKDILTESWNYLRARGEYLNELGLLWHDSQKWAKIRSGI